MGLNNIQTVDAIGNDAIDGSVVLSIIDGWDWTDEQRHLLFLQAKINNYSDFVESRQILDVHPQAEGCGLRIDIVAKYPIPEAGLSLLEKASAIAAKLNMTMSHRVA